MMKTANFACLLAFGAMALTAGPRPCEAARILAIMAAAAKSHHIWFSSLTTALAARGHHVHSYDIFNPEVQLPTLNVTLIDPIENQKEDIENVLKTFNNGTVLEKINLLQEMAVHSCEDLLKTKQMQELISPDFKEEFDLILLSFVLHDCFLGLIHKFNYIPMIVASPFPKPVNIYRLLGNPMFHGIPHYFMDYPMPMTTWQRLTSLAIYAFEEARYHAFQKPRMDTIIRKHFGEDAPTINELSRHIALGLVNLFDTTEKPPLVSNIIPVGGMHIPPVQPLEKNLKAFLDGAKDGAVIMSFGSLVRGDVMGQEKRDAVFKVFSRLKQRLVWKYESSGQNITNIPPNVMILSWLPQNDVLAHPNIRLFVSHCGGLSTMESAYHGVPVLAVPFIVDQFANAERIVASGAGLRLPLTELTEDTFYSNITELLNNPKYYETAQKARSVMQDQLVKPLDRAVYYVEYVLRHKGAGHLRSPLLDQPFLSNTLLIDIIGVVIVLMITTAGIFKLFCATLRIFWRCVRRPSNARTNLSKKTN